MHKAVLALGSNMGNRRENLVRAISALNDVANVFSRSKIYETPPWGYDDQRDFLNAAVAIDTSCEPLELLEFCKYVEKNMGRTITVLNGPRPIDIDIIFYDDLSYSDDVLTIPHSRWRERDFVISPLLDLFDNGALNAEIWSNYKNIIKEHSRAFSPFSAF